MVAGSLSPLAGKELAREKRRGIASLVQSNIANEDKLRLMTPKTRQLHVDKIKTNLPSAYDKFFFCSPDDLKNKNQDLQCTCPSSDPATHPLSKGLSQLPTRADHSINKSPREIREKSYFKHTVR